MMNKGWTNSVVGALYFFYEFIQINMLNSLSHDMSVNFHFTSIQMALLGSSYFYGSLILLIPCGLLLDRFSAKNILIISFAVSLLGTYIFAFSDTGQEIFAGRLIAGFSGGPFCLVSILYISNGWFKDIEFSRVVGVIVAIGTLGGVFSQLPFAFIVHHMGWREAVKINAFIGFVIWVVILIFVKENKEGRRTFIKKPLNRIILDVLKKSQNWRAGIAAGLLNLPIFIFGALLGNLYLTTVKHLSFLLSSWISMMIYVGLLFGSPFWGFLSNKFQLTLYSPLAGIFLCLTGFLMLLYIDLSSLTLSIVFFLLGFGSAAQILSYSTVAKFNEKNTIGTAEALVTWLILGLGGMAQPLAGWLIQQRISLLSNESHVFTILIFVLMGTLVISGVLYYKLTRTEISGRNSLNISLVK